MIQGAVLLVWVLWSLPGDAKWQVRVAEVGVKEREDLNCSLVYVGPTDRCEVPHHKNKTAKEIGGTTSYMTIACISEDQCLPDAEVTSLSAPYFHQHLT